MTAETTQGALSLLDKAPHEIARELERFSESARTLSSNRPRLIDQHPQQWVAVYDGHVEVFGSTLGSVMAQAKNKGLPVDEIIVRYIDKNIKTMIL